MSPSKGTMAPRASSNDVKQEKKAREQGEYLGHIGHMSCYRCKLRGNGVLDPNSNWRLWNADMKVYRDAAGTFAGSEHTDDDEVWASKEEEIMVKMERRRKAMIWFSVSEKLRQEHLTDLGGRDKTSEDVFFRLWEKVAPEGTPYQPLEPFMLSDQDKADIRNFERKKLEGKTPRTIAPNSQRQQAQALQSSTAQPTTLDLPFEERIRRHDAAARMLEDRNLDPDSLSSEQFGIFANQPPKLQNESITMLAKYGAERLRIAQLDATAADSLATTGLVPATNNGDEKKKKKKKKKKSKSKK